MEEISKRVSAWEEHAFWLEILENHAHYIHAHLSSSETKWIQTAKQYIEAFSRMRRQLQMVNSSLPFKSKKMISFAQESYPVVFGYYRFEGHLQHLIIQNLVSLNLSPTYLNGTLSENAEYLRILSFAMYGKAPPEL
ncbi:DUF2935 domain-containing protein [Bacillus taeanensis]|nr:DUF2935 domain-containing protein [Bacillus taeanensis]